MMPSLIKYSIMEIRQVIKRDIVQILEEHTAACFPLCSVRLLVGIYNHIVVQEYIHVRMYIKYSIYKSIQ